MTIFTRVWNSTYESLPEDDDDALEGAARIRHVRVDVGERMKVDHHWDGDVNDGKHKKVTFRPSVGDPTLDPDEVAIYGKTVGSFTELFFKPESGSPIQLTFSGGEPSQVAPGIIALWPTDNPLPSGWIECNGQAISRTTFQALFNVIGIGYGAGNGSTTFNVPDMTGRAVFGKEATQNRITAAVSGVTSTVMGAVGGHEGTQQHTHTANVTDNGHVHGGGSVNLQGFDVNGFGGECFGVTSQGNTGSAGTGISVSNTNFGTGNAGNMPPCIIMKWMIKS